MTQFTTVYSENGLLGRETPSRVMGPPPQLMRVTDHLFRRQALNFVAKKIVGIGKLSELFGDYGIVNGEKVLVVFGNGPWFLGTVVFSLFFGVPFKGKKVYFCSLLVPERIVLSPF